MAAKNQAAALAKLGRKGNQSAAYAGQIAKGHSPVNPAGKTKGWAKGQTIPVGPQAPKTLPSIGDARKAGRAAPSNPLNSRMAPRKPVSGGVVNLGDPTKQGTAKVPGKAIKRRAAGRYAKRKFF